MTQRPFVGRFATVAVGLGLAVGVATAAPQDFSDDFNDGDFTPDRFLLDTDGNLATGADQEPTPLWMPIFGSDRNPTSSVIRIDENRKTGYLRFRSPRNRNTHSYAGYIANGWSFDPLDPLDSPLIPGGSITLPEDEAQAIETTPLRLIGLPDDFSFTVEASFGFNVLRPAINDPVGALTERGMTIALLDTGMVDIGYGSLNDGALVNTGVEVAIENLQGLNALQFRLTRWEGGVAVQEDTTLFDPFTSFEGTVAVSYQNNPVVQDQYLVSFTDRFNRVSVLTIGGVYGGRDSDEGGPIEQMGACCFDDNTCVDAVTSSQCESADGDFRGEDADCDQGNCTLMPDGDGEDIGACCFDDTNDCFDGAEEQECDAAGGDWRGIGSTCDMGNCVLEDMMGMPLPEGACCLDDDTCVEVGAMDCLMMSGIFQGQGVGCVGACLGATEMGACCIPDEDCIEVEADECLAMGGQFQGAGTGCVGACTGGADGGDDGVIDTEMFMNVIQPSLFIGVYSERCTRPIRPQTTFFDSLIMNELTFQLDGNLNFDPDPDFDGDGDVDRFDMAAALTAFPPVRDELLLAILTDAGGPTPDQFIRPRQYNRAVNRWYKRNVIPAFAGQRNRAERRNDRRKLFGLRELVFPGS